MAQFDEESIVVYQAFRPEIGEFAAAEGYFGGEFKLTRMSWIKPNFLWMMYRCGWASKEDQEVVLAIRLKRFAFDQILRQAVASSYPRNRFDSRDEWKAKLEESEVRLQWDPDHLPDGGKLERRAIQLGLRGEALRKYTKEWIIDIEDISDFVRSQRSNAKSDRYSELIIPSERVYPVQDLAIAENLGLVSAQ